MTELSAAELQLSCDVVDFLAPGDDVALTTCDREPIHLSGAIQPHGAMIVVGALDLVIRQVSQNSHEHLGIDAPSLLGMALHRALGLELTDRLRVMLAGPHTSGSDPLACHLSTGAAYELTWHRLDDLVVIELEPAVDTGGVSMPTLFADVRQALAALETAQGVQGLCDVAAAEVRNLTGYDRVMVYRFHGDEHGEVVADEHEPDMESFMGLNYPASDIPRQARKLYLLNQLRVIADVDYQPVPLLGDPDVDPMVLDLSLSGLRSVSPFHLEYLRNMHVGATLTISIMRGTRLWGMLACHHRGPKRIDAQLRAACRVLGQVFSLEVVAHEERDRHAYRAHLAQIEVLLIGRMSGARSLTDALLDGESSALSLTAASGMVARIDGATVTDGVVPSPAAVHALLNRLRADDEPAALVCDDLPVRFPEFEEFASSAAGVLALPLSAAYEDYVLWFRGEVVHSVTWAGNLDGMITGRAAATATPGGPPAAGLGSGSSPASPLTPKISPRQSFASWAQEVRWHSTPWRSAEIDTARALAGAIPELLLARARDRLAHQAMHDSLTGLPNRLLLLDRSAQALARRQRGGELVAMLFIDLDRFKLVNDSLGHAAGDGLLRQAADRIDQAVRGTDTVARIGGDEFIVLCEVATAAHADQLADRIVRAFQAPFLLGSNEAMVTASIGVAVADGDITPAELLRDADTAMYRAKNSGRNAATPFTPTMRALTLRRVEIETRLRPALDHGELRLHFQPVHSTAGTLVGFEALARWKLEGRGMIPPTEFIPVAQATGLMGRLTEWALDEGLAAIARWRTARPDLELTVAVNIAPSQMSEGNLLETVERSLRRHGVPPGALCLEITESALVADDAYTQRFLHRLRLAGVRLSIDDFGTGFSSLAYLTKLPVHELKIDRAFIAGLPSNDGDVAVVASVVALAHQLGLQALAEGVETPDQLATVRRLGCDLVQGYLLGMAMPADEVDRFVAAASAPAAPLVTGGAAGAAAACAVDPGLPRQRAIVVDIRDLESPVGEAS